MICLTNLLDTYVSWFTVITLVLAVITLVLVVIATYMAYRQLKQSNVIGLAQISNEHNWSLYGHYEDLPLSHPAKKQYTKQKYMWRVLHLNHLNLLEVAYEGEKRSIKGSIVDSEKIKQWKQKFKKWFEILETKPMTNDINDGIEALKEIIKLKDEYSNGFRKWLRKGIIPPKFF